MSSGLDTKKLGLVFQSRPDLLAGIQEAADTPARAQLFNSIAQFVHERVGDDSAAEPALKRRRVDVEPARNEAASSNGVSNASADVAAESLLLEIKDISVSVPQRKKFDLCFTAQHLYARPPNATAPAPGMIYAWRDIEYAFCLPVPEKTQVQYNYVLFPADTCLASVAKNAAPPETEPLVFTIPAGAPKPGSIGGPNAGAAAAVSDSYSSLFNWAINKCLQAGSRGTQIVAADPDKFHSVLKQSHRPKEKAVHVKAFRGSKDGFLFFLENGILWGFKKPLLFMPLNRIAAVSYTSVLQRTFNMVVEVFTNEGGDPEATEELEFAMIDQEDYAGINEDYVMRKRLQDRSMADQRKAKLELAENAKAAGAGAGGDADVKAEDEGLTEMEKAAKLEQQLQDEEDEDEEDYDPGSDDESDGSGGTSSDDDEDDEDDEDDGEDDGEEDDDMGEGGDHEKTKA